MTCLLESSAAIVSPEAPSGIETRTVLPASTVEAGSVMDLMAGTTTKAPTQTSAIKKMAAATIAAMGLRF